MPPDQLQSLAPVSETFNDVIARLRDEAAAVPSGDPRKPVAQQIEQRANAVAAGIETDADQARALAYEIFYAYYSLWSQARDDDTLAIVDGVGDALGV